MYGDDDGSLYLLYLHKSGCAAVVDVVGVGLPVEYWMAHGVLSSLEKLVYRSKDRDCS